MGIETGTEHGGAESSFTSAIIAIEELAKVDPSVSVLCDVHNTLVNTVIRKYGTPEQQERWLPQLAESKARQHSSVTTNPFPDKFYSLAVFVCQSRPLVQTRLPSKRVPRRMGTIGSSMVPKCGSQTRMKPKYSSSLPMCACHPLLNGRLIPNSLGRLIRAWAIRVLHVSL